MYTRDMVILANSRKYGGHCIAGKDIETGEWVRLINNRRAQNTIPYPFEENDFLRIGIDPNGPPITTCLRIAFSGKVPLYFQPENEIITGEKWKPLGTISQDELANFVDQKDPIWLGDPCYGYLDSIPVSVCNKSRPLPSSLVGKKLTRRENNITIIHTTPSSGSLQHRLQFLLNGVRYNLAITDVEFENSYRNGGADRDPLSAIYATIGIGQVFIEKEAHYKFVVGLKAL